MRKFLWDYSFPFRRLHPVTKKYEDYNSTMREVMIDVQDMSKVQGDLTQVAELVRMAVLEIENLQRQIDELKTPKEIPLIEHVADFFEWFKEFDGPKVYDSVLGQDQHGSVAVPCLRAMMDAVIKARQEGKIK